jgi:hypothetical protein
VRAVDALPKAKLYTCKRCTLKAGAPIVCAVANPEHAGQGRCSNVEACNRRAKKITQRKQSTESTNA